MNINIEKEYKILVTKDQFELLLKEYPNAVFHKQVNTYYDTTHLDIRKNHGSMRIREVEGNNLFTLKIHTPQGVLEHESYVQENNAKVFLYSEIKALLSSYGFHDEIFPITSLTTYRAVIDTENAELCFDYNEYNGKKDFEIEYEFKKEHDGLMEFNLILAIANLKYKKNCTSKIQRAINSLPL